MRAKPWSAVACLGGLVIIGGCAAPKPALPPIDRGNRIDRAVLDGFQRGVTTRPEAIQLLGEPTAQASDPGEGSTTLTWDYLHVDVHGSIAITTVLKFDADDKLLLKLVNQSSQTVIGDSGKPAN